MLNNSSNQGDEIENVASDNAEALSQEYDADVSEIPENVTHCSTEEVRNTRNNRTSYSNDDLLVSEDSDAGSVHYESFADQAGIGLSGSFSPRRTTDIDTHESDGFVELSVGQREQNIIPNEIHDSQKERVVRDGMEIFPSNNSDGDPQPPASVQRNVEDEPGDQYNTSQIDIRQNLSSTEEPLETGASEEHTMKCQTLSGEDAHEVLECPHSASAVGQSINDSSEGVDLSAIAGHLVSNAELAQLRHVAAASSIFDDTSSMANTESTFTTAVTNAGSFVRRTESRDFKDAVQTNLGLGPLEEGPELTPKEGTPRRRSGNIGEDIEFAETPVLSPSELRRSPESGAPPQSMLDDPKVSGTFFAHATTTTTS